jgi:transposase
MPRQTSMITKAILEDHANGMSRQAISEKHGLSYSIVASAIWRHTKKKTAKKTAPPKPVKVEQVPPKPIKVEQVPPTPAKLATVPVQPTFWQRLKNLLGL